VNFFNVSEKFFSFVEMLARRYCSSQHDVPRKWFRNVEPPGGNIMKLSSSNESNARKIAVTFAFSALVFSSISGAEEQQVSYTLTAISNASFGQQVTTGEYDHAIDKITSPGFNERNSFEAKTNLCIAYLKTGAVGVATETCDDAVAKSQKRMRFDGSNSISSIASDSRRKTDLALALSNRGVLRAVKGELELAREDFLQAIDLDTGLSAPTVNLARLETDAPVEVLSSTTAE
jgi:tetratricopeptide (TPR) repeat protein